MSTRSNFVRVSKFDSNTREASSSRTVPCKLSEWPGKKPFYMIDFLKNFKPVSREPTKRPVGRPRKRAATTAATSSKCTTSVSSDSVFMLKQSQETQDELHQDTRKSNEQPPGCERNAENIVR